MKPRKSYKIPVTDHLGNTYPSKADMCRAYNISEMLFLAREGCGWDVRKILTTPPLRSGGGRKKNNKQQV